MSGANLEPLSGFRDFMPRESIFRQGVIMRVREVFEGYGFVPLETPAAERPEVLEGKYGEEGTKLIFRILRRGSELDSSFMSLHETQRAGERHFADLQGLSDMALRYDLTVPLARVVARNISELSWPFKRYQIAPVWRADKPGEGRFREFYQCDVDTVGSSSMSADAEFVLIISDTLRAVGFDDFFIRINNRKILDGLMERFDVVADQRLRALQLIDKLDKVNPAQVIAEMVEDGIDSSITDAIIGVIVSMGNFDPESQLAELANEIGDTATGAAGLSELAEVFSYLQPLGLPADRVRLDVSMARGLDYYTGTIYETVLRNAPDVGSVMSGGRFDELVGMFAGRDIPAVGVSLGLDRLFSVMERSGMVPAKQTTAEVLVACLGEACMPYAMAVAQRYRGAGIATLLYTNPIEGAGRQIGYAKRLGIPLVAIVGGEETANNTVMVKNMEDRTQCPVKFDELPTV